LKKFASAGIGLLSVVVALAMMAGPADARAHRHHRHHRHGGGGGGPGIVCGPGTTNVNGVCVANPPSGPIGNNNFNINPSSITMNLDGTFSASATLSGLPPNIAFNAATAPQCGPGGAAIGLALTGPTDALGRAQLLVFRAGAPGCVPGSYPITLTEATSPFATFVGIVNLHF